MTQPVARFPLELVEGTAHTERLLLTDGESNILDLDDVTSFSFELSQDGSVVATASTTINDAAAGDAQWTLASGLVDTLSGTGTWRLTALIGSDSVLIAYGGWRWYSSGAGAGVDPPPASRAIRVPFIVQAAVGGGSGDVTGPASAVDGNLPSFSGPGGKALQDSGVAASEVTANTAKISATAANVLLALAAAAGSVDLNGQAITNVGNVDGVDIAALAASLASYQPASEKGSANGYAELDSGGKVPAAQLPLSNFYERKGTWDASTNTPALASGTGDDGDTYLVTVDGSTSLDGISDWKAGDIAIFLDSAWRKIDNTDAVNSVVGLTGTITQASLLAALLASLGTPGIADADVIPFGDTSDGGSGQGTTATALATYVLGKLGASEASGVLAALAAAASSVDVNGQKITGLGTPTASTDAVTKAYADALGGGGGIAYIDSELDTTGYASNSTSEVDAHVYTTPTLDAGTYLVLWDAVVTNSNTTAQGRVRVYFDGATQIGPKTSFYAMNSNASGNRFTFAGHALVVVASGGSTHTLKNTIEMSGSATTMTIFSSTFTLLKVA